MLYVTVQSHCTYLVYIIDDERDFRTVLVKGFQHFEENGWG
jgi:hypothetical protein